MYQDRTSSVYPIHRPQTNVSPKLTLFLTSLCVSWLCISWVGSNWVASQETKSNQKTRTLFVPYEDLNILFDGSSQHVYLSKKEYEDLIVKAKPVPVEKAPRSFVYTNVTHEASITGELARIKSRLTIESMEDHLLAIPIPFRGVSLQAAAHADGSQAPLGKNRNGQTVVFLKGKKKHQLDLEFVGLVKLETAKQSLDFQLPPAALAKLDVSVNGNVELAEGPAVISRTYDQASNRTAFGLVPSRGMTSLVMSVNNKKLQQKKSILAKSVFIHELTSNYEQIHARINVDILYGATDSVRFELPEGFQLTEVSCPEMNSWSVETKDGKSELVVRLRESVSQPFALNVAALSTKTTPKKWKLSPLKPIDFSGAVSVVGIVAEERFELQSLATGGLFAIDNGQIQSSIPETVFKTSAGAPAIATVAAFYAPDNDFSLDAEFAIPDAALEISPTSILFLSDRRQMMIGQYQLSAKHEKVVNFDLKIPQNWRVTSIKDAQGKSLPFQRIVTNGQGQLNVRMPGGLAAGTQTSIVFEAQSAAEDWTRKWESIQIDFPRFEIEGSVLKKGAVAVAVEDDLVVRPGTTQNLETLLRDQKSIFGLEGFNTSIAFEIVEQDFAAQLTVERLKSQVTATSYNFFKFLNKQIAVNYEVAFDIQTARSRTLQFLLPKSTPDEIRIRGLDGVRIAQTDSKEIEAGRLWTLELAEPSLGEIRVVVDFVHPLDSEEPQGFELPLIQAQQVGYQTSLVSFEGNPDFDFTIQTEMRSIDVGEMGDASYVPGTRLLGAFSGVNDDAGMTIDVSRRDIHQLPTAIVQSALLRTVVSKNGTSQSVAEYSILTKVPFVELSMPENAELWAAQLDGVPSRPQLRGDSVLISLPPDSNQQVRKLSIFYEDTISTVGLSGKVKLQPPQLLIRSDLKSDPVLIPQAKLDWQVTLPSGYTISSNEGSVFTTREERRALPFEAVYSALGRLLPSADLLGGNKFNDIASDLESARSGSVDAKSPASADYLLDYDRFADTQMAEDESRVPNSRVNPSKAKTESAPEFEQTNRQGKSRDTKGADIKSTAGGRSSGDSAKSERRDSESITKGKKLQLWAKKGIKGLTVSELSLDFGEDSRTFHLQSLGREGDLSVTIIDQDRIRWLSFAYGGLVIAFGLFLCRFRWKVKLAYIMLIVLVAATVPMLGDWTQTYWSGLENSLFACCFLLFAYFVHFVFSGILGFIYRDLGKFFRWMLGMGDSGVTAAILLLALIGSQTVAVGQESQSTKENSATAKPIEIPADAIIVPYDPENPDKQSDQIFIPYDRYVELMKQSDPKLRRTTKPLPADFGWTKATYESTLDGKDLVIRGKIELEPFTDKPISIPLHFDKAVVTEARLDGQPAKLRVVPVMVAQKRSSKNQKSQQRVPVAQNRAEPELDHLIETHVSKTRSQLMLLTEGAGTKTLELELRVPIQQAGGWRKVAGRLPVAPASQIKLEVPDAGSELNYQIQGRTVKFIADKPADVATLPVSNDGQFQFSWRSKVSVAKVDQNLTLNSTALFDVRNDGLHLVWNLDFLFRASKRTNFDVELPKDFSVVRVYGQNIRGWQIREEPQANILEVTLLSEADSKEKFTIELSNREMDLAVATSFPMPTVVIPDAAIHSGQITVRKSDSLELQTDTMIGISRIDISEARKIGPKAEPLFNPTVFQAFEFSRTPFSVAIRCRPKPKGIQVKTRSLVDIREKSCGLDSQILCSSNRPIHELTIDLPLDLEIQKIGVPAPFRQAVTRSESQQTLKLFLSSGLKGDFGINISGRLNDHEKTGQIPLPKVRVREATRQSGEVSAIAEPQLIVEPQSLKNCETALLSTVGWLNNRNRSLARVALIHKSDDFDGQLKVTRKSPKVSVTSISNVNVTLRSIEESVMINFDIRDAGIDSVSFLIPSQLKDARIKADLVREKTIMPVGDDANPKQYRVTLKLQDFVIDEYRVLLELDRGLTAELQAASIPAFEAGVENVGKYVTLQNSGFDELLVKGSLGLQSLDRRQKQFRDLKNLIGGADIRQAYLVDAGEPAPELNYQTNQRQLVETVGASIGLSEIEMTLDRAGSYRAEQKLYVDNRTEPFLEIELPTQSKLWTVQVAGAPVKPIAIKGDDRAVRIPLIKTADGGTDFLVSIKYGGSVGKLTNLAKLKFPFTQTRNVRVESSNVKLNLPEDFDFWWFDGSMGVSEEKQIRQAKSAYETALFSKLKSRAKNSKSELVRQRAAQNLSILQQDDDLDDVQQEAVEMDEIQIDNRETFNELFDRQRTKLLGNSGNIANAYGGNFGEQKASQQGQQNDKVFNSKWLDSNGLVNPKLLEQNKNNTRFNAPQFQSPGKVPPGQKPGANASGGAGGGGFGGMAGNFKSGEAVQKELQQRAQREFQKQIADNLNVLQEQSQKAKRGGNKKDAIIRKYRSQLSNRANPVDLPSLGSRPTNDPDSGPQQILISPTDSGRTEEAEEGRVINNDFRQSGFATKSLDVQFEHQGQSFLFQAPSGELELEVTVVSKSMKRRATNFVVLFGMVCLMGCCLWFFGNRKRQGN